MPTVNHSLWQDRAGIAGIIRHSPIPSTVADNELLIRDVALPFIKYPLILGEDVAGTVEEVGSAAAAAGFQPGDRVLGLALGAVVFKPEHGAFQDYVTLDHSLVCKIPHTLSFAQASVFPLCVATTAHGLFSKDYLGLPFPACKSSGSSHGRSILIWGGSSGVGSNAIHLAKAAGFTVITTCSTRNFDHDRRLGASKVFDYNDPDVVDSIVAELDHGEAECSGILQAAGPVDPSCQVASKSKQTLRVAATNPVPEDGTATHIEAKMIFAAGGAVIYHETNQATFAGYLAEALANGLYQVAPPPEIIPTRGLEGIQEALTMLKKGVSAKKLVVLAE